MSADLAGPRAKLSEPQRLRPTTPPIIPQTESIKPLQPHSTILKSTQGSQKLNVKKKSSLADLLTRITQPTASSRNKSRHGSESNLGQGQKQAAGVFGKVNHASQRPQISRPIVEDGSTRLIHDHRTRPRWAGTVPGATTAPSISPSTLSRNTSNLKISRPILASHSLSNDRGVSPDSRPSSAASRGEVTTSISSSKKVHPAHDHRPSVISASKRANRTSAPSPQPGSTATKPRRIPSSGSFSTLSDNSVSTGSRGQHNINSEQPNAHSPPSGNGKKTTHPSQYGDSRSRGSSHIKVHDLKNKVTELEQLLRRVKSDRGVIAAKDSRIIELEMEVASMPLARPSIPSPPLTPSDSQVDVEARPGLGKETSDPNSGFKPGRSNSYPQQNLSLKQENESLRRAVDRARDASKHAEARVAQQAEQISKLQAESVKTLGLWQRDINQLDRMEDDFDLCKATCENYKRQIEGYAAANQTLEKRLYRTQKELRQARRKAAALATNECELKVTIEEKNMEIDELNRSLNRIMRQADEAAGLPNSPPPSSSNGTRIPTPIPILSQSHGKTPQENVISNSRK